MANRAVSILGDSIRAARLRRGWSVALLAQRVGVSIPTITKIERGDPSVSIGSVFDAAWLVGVELYGDNQDLAGRIARSDLALLPQRGRSRQARDNDF